VPAERARKPHGEVDVIGLPFVTHRAMVEKPRPGRRLFDAA